MGHVLAQLDVVGEALGEGPRVVHFGDGELVEGHFGVDACPRVAVPEPDAAKVVCWGRGLDVLGMNRGEMCEVLLVGLWVERYVGLERTIWV